MDVGSASDRVRALQVKGTALVESAPQPSSLRHARVDAQSFSGWRAQALALLTGLLGPEHVYTEQFRTEVAENLAVCARRGLGILAAVEEDLDGGYLFQISALVAAEVFADFLDMAQHLVEQGYVVPAASLAGAVLEDGLRRAAVASGWKATGNLESLNDLSAEKGLYDRLVYKQVKVWIGVRNAADHADFAAVTSDLVGSMLRDLPAFMAKIQPT